MLVFQVIARRPRKNEESNSSKLSGVVPRKDPVMEDLLRKLTYYDDKYGEAAPQIRLLMAEYKYGKTLPLPESVIMFGKQEMFNVRFTPELKKTILGALREGSQRTGLPIEFLAACFVMEGGALAWRGPLRHQITEYERSERNEYCKYWDDLFKSVSNHMLGVDYFTKFWEKNEVQPFLPSDFDKKFMPYLDHIYLTIGVNVFYRTYNYITRNKIAFFSEPQRGFHRCENPYEHMENYHNLVLAFCASIKRFERKMAEFGLLNGISKEDQLLLTYLANNFGEGAMQKKIGSDGFEAIRKLALNGSGSYRNAARVMAMMHYFEGEKIFEK